MKEFKLKESTVPNEIVYNLKENYSITWYANRTYGLYRVIFFTIARILKLSKSKSATNVGFALKDLNGNFKFGAILTYHAPEDKDDSNDDKGNYTLEFTLNESDMQDLDIIKDNYSDLFDECAGSYAEKIMTGRFKSNEYCNILFIEFIDAIIKFLDANASEDEEVSLVYTGIFTATVTVEGGEKTISITPGEMIKQFIKDDASL